MAVPQPMGEGVALPPPGACRSPGAGTAATYGRAMPKTFLVVLLLCPTVIVAPARAAVRTVSVGLPLEQHRAFWGVGTGVNAFFPARTVVHAGDVVRFRSSGYDSVHLGGRGARVRAIGTTVASAARVGDERDAAGQAF